MSFVDIEQNNYYCRYLKLVRKLQVTYRMEPAGSQGVWSLDDFQFIAFIWGSAQLIGNSQQVFSSFDRNGKIFLN